MKKLILTILFLVSSFFIFAQSLNWNWATNQTGGGGAGTRALSTDQDGHLIVAGTYNQNSITFGTVNLYNSNPFQEEIFIVKYDSSGNVIWAKSPSGSGYDYVSSIISDNYGNFYLAGTFTGQSISFDSFTLINNNPGLYNIYLVKYDPWGNVIWATTQTGSANSVSITAIALNKLGHLIITGSFNNTLTLNSISLANPYNGPIAYVAKLDSWSGSCIQAYLFGSVNTLTTGVCVDTSNNIYVTGNYSSTLIFGSTILTNGGGFDIFIVKLSLNGSIIWAKKAGGSSSDYSNTIKLDFFGNILLAGYFNSPVIYFDQSSCSNWGKYDVFLAKFDINGGLIWAKSFGGNENEYANVLVTDQNNHIYLAGEYLSPVINLNTTSLTNTSINSDIFIAKFHENGSELFALSLGDYSSESVYAIDKNQNGEIIIGGSFGSQMISFGAITLNKLSSYDMFVAKFTDSSSSISITTHPSGTYSCSGDSLSLSVSALGNGLTYQWRKNGINLTVSSNIMNVNSSILTIDPFFPSDTGSYDVVITESTGFSLISNIAFVTLNLIPIATITASGSTSICAGNSVSLNANTGTGLSYQWQLNGNNISGATASSYSANSAGNYTAVVSNACGSSTSNIISVTTGAAPSASITASGFTSICAGGSVTLNANTGTGLSYQWQLNGNNISGATASSYSAGTAGNYTAVVSNACGSSTSNVISVTIGAAPSAAITASGSTSICAGGSVTLNANTGTGLTYQWQLNGNNILGATTSSYSATTSGNYSVFVTNSCGNSVSNIISISVISAPGSAGAISGPTSFCRHSTKSFSVSPVTGATNYSWTVPPQATIISGLGTNSVVVSFIVKQGDITVKAFNNCGSGPLSVLPVQLLKCANPNSNNPNSPLRTAFNTIIYPNPSLDDFNCEIQGEEDQVFSLRVFDYSGRIVELKENLVSNKNFSFGNDLAPGFYFVEIKSGDDKEIYKVIKTE